MYAQSLISELSRTLEKVNLTYSLISITRPWMTKKLTKKKQIRHMISNYDIWWQIIYEFDYLQQIMSHVRNNCHCTALTQQMRLWQGVFYNACPLSLLSPLSSILYSTWPHNQLILTTLITWQNMKILTWNFLYMIRGVPLDDIWNLT